MLRVQRSQIKRNRLIILPLYTVVLVQSSNIPHQLSIIRSTRKLDVHVAGGQLSCPDLWSPLG